VRLQHAKAIPINLENFQIFKFLVDPPHTATLKIARAADIVILPTGLSLDDLQPSVLLAHELAKKGVAKVKIAFALCRVGESHLEIIEAQIYLNDAGYRVLTGSIPEKIAYRRASDEGRALTETRFPTLNDRADRLAQSIIDLVSKLKRAA
jgi:chromosome partitioning protein